MNEYLNFIWQNLASLVTLILLIGVLIYLLIGVVGVLLVKRKHKNLVL